ncbi:MAG: HDOD domain-containing protein, partial [Candidatus Heimdallarchaeota archaeon]|nr:HDOD domain-containing protein [Candidatus Heimdallarchaeota archaeon]
NYDLDTAMIDNFHRIVVHSEKVDRFLPELFHLRYGSEIVDELETAGILHDIGKIVLLSCLPDRFTRILKNQSGNPGMTFYESEIDLGFKDCTHAEVGGYLLDYWGLPETIVNIVNYHHSDDGLTGRNRKLLEALKSTDKLVNFADTLHDQSKFEQPDIKIPNITGEECNKLILQIRNETFRNILSS